MSKQEPKLLTDDNARQHARAIRDFHWRFLERLGSEGVVHVCTWNKNGTPETANELRLCLISGMELADWMARHPDWFEIGPQDKSRWTNAVAITAAGREALQHRDRYDLEPVRGGLVEPGWQAVPAAQLETAADV